MARKPEEILREDPMPSLHVKAKESCKESVTVKTVKNEDFYRQDSYLERCFNKKQLVDSWYMGIWQIYIISWLCFKDVYVDFTPIWQKFPF